MVLLSWIMQMRGRFVVLNWILSERVTAAAAPLYQNLPVGNLTGYTVDIRVIPSHACCCHTDCMPTPLPMLIITGGMGSSSLPCLLTAQQALYGASSLVEVVSERMVRSFWEARLPVYAHCS